MGLPGFEYPLGNLASGRADSGAGAAAVAFLRMQRGEPFIVHVFQPTDDFIRQKAGMADLRAASAADAGVERYRLAGGHREQAGIARE